MQATVLSFDPATTSGSLVTDEGRVYTFAAEAFQASGLRLLRSGQRMRATVAIDGTIITMTILTLPDPQLDR